MAITVSNAAFGGFHGRLGNLVFRQCDGRTIVSRRPRPSSRPPTERQLAQQDHFRRGALIARSVLEDPARRERYLQAAGRNKQKVFGLAVADALRPPEIGEIDLDTYAAPQGNLVRIEVQDVIVDRVDVVLRLRDGTVFAAGPAETTGPWWWFRTATPIPRGELAAIEGTARDLAGNESTKVESADQP